MGITVGDIYSKYPQFRQEDMVKLVGNTNFNGRTTISLSNLASYNGQYAQDLGIFVAEREGNSFTKLLPENQQQRVNEKLGIMNNDGNKNSLASISHIPMNQSIFDIKKPELA